MSSAWFTTIFGRVPINHSYSKTPHPNQLLIPLTPTPHAYGLGASNIVANMTSLRGTLVDLRSYLNPGSFGSARCNLVLSEASIDLAVPLQGVSLRELSSGVVKYVNYLRSQYIYIVNLDIMPP